MGHSKSYKMGVGLFTDEYEGVNDDFWINVLAYGDPISISDLW